MADYRVYYYFIYLITGSPKRKTPVAVTQKFKKKYFRITQWVMKEKGTILDNAYFKYFSIRRVLLWLKGQVTFLTLCVLKVECLALIIHRFTFVWLKSVSRLKIALVTNRIPIKKVTCPCKYGICIGYRRQKNGDCGRDFGRGGWRNWDCHHCGYS